MGEFVRDLRYAARLYRNSPGFAITTALLLALGIAANTILFSIIDAVFLRALPVDRPEELVQIVYRIPGAPPFTEQEYPFYRVLREKRDLFAGVAGHHEMNIAMRDGAASDRVRADFVTGNFFSLLGVRPLHGRVLSVEDERATAALPIVLSHPFWKRRFKGDPSVVGRRIWLQGRDAVIAGVTPPEFNGLTIETSPDVRVPFTALPALIPDIKKLDETYVDVVTRLHPGATLDQAQAGFVAVWNNYLDSSPSENREYQRRLQIGLQSAARGVSRLRSQFSSALIFLMAAAGLLLLIVCANVAGLLLARSAARRQEIAIRAAVGASGGRLIRQMLTESALLTLLGGASGLLIAFAAMPVVTKVLPPIRHLDATSLPIVLRIEPDLRILGFSILLCALTAVFFGLGPALQVARRDFYSSMKTARSTRRWTGRHGTVVAQIALCTFLTIAAGLLIATLERLRNMNPGFDQDHIVTFSADTDMRGYTPQQTRDIVGRLVELTSALPGVEQVALAGRGLMRGTGIKITVQLPGQAPDPKERLNTSLNWVTPEYFQAMGMRLLAGRNFMPKEGQLDKLGRVVVNRAFARRFFPDLDPIGRRFGPKAGNEVIGIVTDAKYRSLREPIPPTVYSPWLGGSFILHVRTKTPPESIIGPVQDIMRAVDPELPFYEINTLASEVDASLWSERLLAALASVFAVAAALLAAIGIYGLLAYSVAQRTPEIGIRMALGARPRNIFRLISSQAAAMVATGVAVGVGGAILAAPAIGSLLYETPPNDPATLTIAGVFVILIAFGGAAIPAIRATRVEPAAALRHAIIS